MRFLLPCFAKILLALTMSTTPTNILHDTLDILLLLVRSSTVPWIGFSDFVA